MGFAEQIAAKAHQLGFDLFGWTTTTSYPLERYHSWLEEGYQGAMGYLARPDAVAKRADLTQVLPEVSTVFTVGCNYHTQPLPAALANDPARGILSSYAWGDDYHDILLPRLRELGDFVEETSGQVLDSRAYVDTGPLLERTIAARAGNGFIGKNTNLIHPRWGSWLFLGELLLAGPLEGVSPAPAEELAPLGTCGRCTRCLDACPTGALVAPHILDARLCISYLTIELKGAIPHRLRPLVGNRIFGCDVCQEVCPWNKRFARLSQDPAFQPRPGNIAPQLLELMALDDEAFRQRFQASPVKRAKRRGLLRNVAVALGNWGNRAAVPELTRALHDAEPLVRGHAAWALGRIGTDDAQAALVAALAREADEGVWTELEQALDSQWTGQDRK
jgi:epoxyqueuosine reductase